jgi:TPR repeat protein
MASLTQAVPNTTIPNRRRRVRHKILTPAYASFARESSADMLDLYEILDISEDGFAIHCDSPLEAGQSFDLCLDLAESTGLIYTMAQVVWWNGSGRAGFRFAGLPSDAFLRLREWLFVNAMAGVANARADSADAAVPSAVLSLRPNHTDTLAALAVVQREVESLGPDLVAALQLIADRARTLVRASGAAIALAADDPRFMICGASSGTDAPPLGARLEVGSGFSGECVRSRKLLRCDDSETDARVDRESCRMLGIRSILAVPMRMGERTIGILEVFAPQPNHFGNGDGKTLQRLAEIVPGAVQRASRPLGSPPPAEAPQPPGSPLKVGSVLFGSEAEERTKQKTGLEAKGSSGISLPLFHLILLFCAAAAISMTLGVLLAPTIQSYFQAHGPGRMSTVLASSQPEAAKPPAPAPTPSISIETASLEQLRQLAEGGNPAAQNALGVRYATGDGVKLDAREAVNWFTKSAAQGNVAAQSKLGSLYWAGRGVAPSLNQAYFWTVLARAGGDKASKTLAPVLASHLTAEQARAIEREAENWLQQHQATSKPGPGR